MYQSNEFLHYQSVDDYSGLENSSLRCLNLLSDLNHESNWKKKDHSLLEYFLKLNSGRKVLNLVRFVLFLLL